MSKMIDLEFNGENHTIAVIDARLGRQILLFETAVLKHEQP